MNIVLLIFACICFFITVGLLGSGNALGLLFGLIGVILVVVVIIKCSKVSNENYRRQCRINFYNECKAAGITEFTSPKEIERAKLIAQKYNLDASDLPQLYNSCKSLVESVNKANQAAAQLEENKRLEALKNEEIKENQELTKYKNHKGREKRMAMLLDRSREESNRAKTLRAGADALYLSTQQKEKDWAIAGGIASGIAGPAVGLATALDVQSKNEKIRERNMQAANSVAPIVSTSREGASECVKRAESYMQEYEETKTKLVSEDSPNDYFNKLLFSDTTYEITETGTIKVTTFVQLKGPLFIFDDVRAVVDGTVNVNVIRNDKVVGTAEIVLPLRGVDQQKVKLTGMALFCGKKGREYSFDYAPRVLWAIER